MLKQYLKPKLICENKQSIQILYEALGVFNGQYQIAELIGCVVFDMLINDISSQTITNIDNECINNVEIELDTNTIMPNISGSIIKLNPTTKTIGIRISMPQSLKGKNSSITQKRIQNVIVHELMHGNVFLKRFDNDAEIEDAPEYYNVILYMMGVADANSIIYKFCYALYATYYQEVNAIISPTNIQMYNILGYGKDNSNDEIKNAIRKTEPYLIYSTILYDTIPILENLSDEDIETFIISELKKLDIDNFTVDFIRKKIKHIKLIAMKALRNVFRNAMLEGKSIQKELIF